jgi:peptidoglycan/xylan/chitin deacetylase (PgdA/CDA1 family)
VFGGQDVCLNDATAERKRQPKGSVSLVRRHRVYLRAMTERAQLAVTFDVDAESVWLAASPDYERRLSTLSEARYGVGRGLTRVLELLERYEAQATFYVPGATAERHPTAITRVLEAGHVVGHHGHDHLKSHAIDADSQRREIERGFEALERLGVKPDGYRSPAWELTPETLALLGEAQFVWDSSLMEDDRPYEIEAGTHTLIELPVHWTLDDWPWFGWTDEAGGSLGDADMVARVWEHELRVAIDEKRPITITMHPEVIGRPHRLLALERVLVVARASDIPVVSHATLAASVGAAR